MNAYTNGNCDEQDLYVDILNKDEGGCHDAGPEQKQGGNFGNHGHSFALQVG